MSEIDIRTGEEEVINVIRFADEDTGGATAVTLDDDGDVAFDMEYVSPENVGNLTKALQKAVVIWDTCK